MPEQSPSTLKVIFPSWRGYHEKRRECIALLPAERLRPRPATHMWPLGQIVQHIVSVRDGRFSGTLQEGVATIRASIEWGRHESPARSLATRGQLPKPTCSAGRQPAAP